MNDNFRLIKNIKAFIINLEKIVKTFPKNDILTRNMIYDDSLELLELVCCANYCNFNKELKKEYQMKALSKVNKIDFYLERAFILKYINDKQLKLKTNELSKINNILISWSKND